MALSAGPEGGLCPAGRPQPSVGTPGRAVRRRSRTGRLLGVGRDDLAARVEWVAETCGDGVGFDVLSFDGADESEWRIEVKTTGLGKCFPFYVSANEVRCSEDCRSGSSSIGSSTSPEAQVYVLSEALSQAYRLESGGVPGVGDAAHDELTAPALAGELVADPAPGRAGGRGGPCIVRRPSTEWPSLTDGLLPRRSTAWRYSCVVTPR